MIALIAVQLAFGSLPVIGKIVLTIVSAVALVGIRVGLTAVVLFIIQMYRGRIWLRYANDYTRLAVLSLFGVVFNQYLFIGGLSLTRAANASLLSVTIPIFTLLISIAVGSDKLRGITIFGIILAAAGVVLLVNPGAASFSSQTTIGDMMIVINSLSYGIYVASSKEVITRNGPFRSMMWVFIFASVICVPIGVISFGTVETANMDRSIWFLLLYIALGATAVPYFLNAWALARVSPAMVAAFIYLQPLIGFVMAVIFLGEEVGLRFIIAALLIFAGLFLTTRTSSAPAGHITA